MPRRMIPEPPSQPEFPLEKMHSILKKQLAALDDLRGRNYREAESDETQWMNLTLNVSNLPRYFPLTNFTSTEETG
jgi:hypothetical protein